VRALVTGGTGRIGSAIVARLQGEGWTVVAAGRADGDLAAVEQARALVERAVEELGGLDLLVNAAGEGFAPRAVTEVTEADWDAAFGATVKGSFFVTQTAAAHLRASHGCIVMIEDVAAYQPWPSFAAHCAAKAAQAMLTRVLARAPDKVGHWVWAERAPFGPAILAQWSGECEVPVAYLASQGRLHPFGGESVALGWLPTGEAVIHFPNGPCAFGWSPVRGIYAALGTTKLRLLLRTKRFAQYLMWGG